MDIYEYIKLDHKKISELFSLFEKTNDIDLKSKTVDMIIKELFVHLESEQETFYKTLENFAKTKDVVAHGEKEHQSIENLIQTLMDEKPSQAWKGNVQELKRLVEHHVREEEGKVHSEAKKVLSDEEAYTLKEKMHYFKVKLLQKIQA